jgi:ferredoxin, 2Fe-2S
MPLLTIKPHADLCPQGASLEVASGTSVCRALLDNGIAIEHACELSCACTTCHVYVREGANSLESASDLEEDMLDKAWGVNACSRLACQIVIGQTALTVEIPKYTVNHARENH